MNESWLSLSRTTHKLQAFLGAAGTPEVIVHYHDVQLGEKKDFSEYPIGVQITSLNGTNETDILDAPKSTENICRHIDSIICCNDEASPITLTVVLDVSGTNNRLWKKLLAVDQSFTASKAGVQII